jgi:hypothetical protein
MVKKLIKWIVIHQHPFTIVEETYFIELVYSFYPEANIPSADTIKRNIIDLYELNLKNIQIILQKLPGKISFTIDIWTSPSTKSFLYLTGHFIDINWKLQNTIIDFIEIFESHSGENIKEVFVLLLKNYSIQNKVKFII